MMSITTVVSFLACDCPQNSVRGNNKTTSNEKARREWLLDSDDKEKASVENLWTVR